MISFLLYFPQNHNLNCYLSSSEVGGNSLPEHLPLMYHLGSFRLKTPINQLMDFSFGIFNDRDRVEQAKRIQGKQEKA